MRSPDTKQRIQIGSPAPFCRERLSCRYGGADRRGGGDQGSVPLQALFRQTGHIGRHPSPNGGKETFNRPADHQMPEENGTAENPAGETGHAGTGRLNSAAPSFTTGRRKAFLSHFRKTADTGTIPRPGNGPPVRAISVRRASHVSDGYFPASGGFAGGGTPAGTGILRSHVSIIQCIRRGREKRGGAAGRASRPLHGKDERKTRIE